MKENFEKMNAPRQAWKIEHNLSEIVIMTIIAVIVGFGIWEDIADYCIAKSDWFKEKIGLKLENGVASHDTFRRVLGLIKPTELEVCFRNWVNEISEITHGEIVGIDGKTLRGSRDEKSLFVILLSMH